MTTQSAEKTDPCLKKKTIILLQRTAAALGESLNVLNVNTAALSKKEKSLGRGRHS